MRDNANTPLCGFRLALFKAIPWCTRYIELCVLHQTYPVFKQENHLTEDEANIYFTTFGKGWSRISVVHTVDRGFTPYFGDQLRTQELEEADSRVN